VVQEIDYPGSDILVFRGPASKVRTPYTVAILDLGSTREAGVDFTAGASLLSSAGEWSDLQERGAWPSHQVLPTSCSLSCMAVWPMMITQQGLTAIYQVVMSNGVLDWDKPETWTAMIDRSPCGTGSA
jgi:hypothetical protein